MNPTIEKFGYPATLLRDYRHWVLLLRPAQVTLGSLILAAKSDVTAYGDLPAAAFTEQHAVIRSVERALTAFVRYERVNYLMLMMVDPNVHFHVIPRYPDGRHWDGQDFPDRGWPGPPDLPSASRLSDRKINQLAKEIILQFD